MSQVINTNVASLNSQRQLNKSQASLDTSLERLSSGLRINSAKDDAAGLAISQRMTAQISGMNVAVRNANDGISLAQTAEGTLSSISDNLQRMRELAVQSANASNSTTDRVAIQQEVSQLSAEIDRVATQTDFNGTKLLDGSFSAQQFQVGANVGQTITVTQIDSARTSALGQFTGFQLNNQTIGTASDTAAAKSITVGGATISLGTIANDGKALAAAMNASGIGGLTVTANATAVASATTTVSTTTAGTATLAINGLTITLNATTNGATNRANAVTAINAQSTVTGVVATDDGTGVKLAAQDGRNITVGGFALGTAVATTIADFGLAAAATTGSTVNVTYQAAKGTTGNMTFTGAFNPGAQAIGVTGTAINAIDVTTQQGANTALTAIDAALASVNSSKANLGAIQNRFTSVVANLQSTSENLSASRSRIRDADFAEETANMSKANILQQAGTAMLAQANSKPQNVLSLLK
jgi:flagellin